MELEAIRALIRAKMEITNDTKKTFFLHGDCYVLWMEERPASSSGR